LAFLVVILEGNLRSALHRAQPQTATITKPTNVPLNPLPTRAFLLLVAVTAYAQEASTPMALTSHPKPHVSRSETTFNPSLIVLDPAHGGADNGARFADGVFEKDITTAFAGRLRTLLAGRGFTVVITHEAAGDDLALDQRVDIANRNRPLACLLLHAANGGHGVHLYSSSLPPAPPVADIPESYRPLIPWDTAQTADLEQSVGLKADLSAAILGIRVPLVAGQASVRPIDSMHCPAVALEIAPLENGTPVTDENYQQRVGEALAGALVNWRDHAVAESLAADAARAAEAERQAQDSGSPPPEPPRQRPKHKPPVPATSFPDEAPSDAPVVTKPKHPPPIQPPSGGQQ
jgi:N-acetylmuramoyl-L-alanine amidase